MLRTNQHWRGVVNFSEIRDQMFRHHGDSIIFANRTQESLDLAGKKRKLPTTERVLHPLQPCPGQGTFGNGKVYSHILFLNFHWRRHLYSCIELELLICFNILNKLLKIN